MFNVVNIDTHPNFKKERNSINVWHHQILGLHGKKIEHCFMEHRLESQAVIAFLREVGFVVHEEKARFPLPPSEAKKYPVQAPTFGGFATYNPTEFPSDAVSIKLPPTFELLSSLCGMNTFRNRELTYTQIKTLGRLGIASNLAQFAWEQKHKAKVA